MRNSRSLMVMLPSPHLKTQPSITEISQLSLSAKANAHRTFFVNYLLSCHTTIFNPRTHAIENMCHIFIKFIKPRTSQSVSWPVNPRYSIHSAQSVRVSASQSVSQSVIQSASQPASQSVSQSVSQAVS